MANHPILKDTTVRPGGDPPISTAIHYHVELVGEDGDRVTGYVEDEEVTIDGVFHPTPDADGTVRVTLWPNATIVPAGTRWKWTRVLDRRTSHEAVLLPDDNAEHWVYDEGILDEFPGELPGGPLTAEIERATTAEAALADDLETSAALIAATIEPVTVSRVAGNVTLTWHSDTFVFADVDQTGAAAARELDIVIPDVVVGDVIEFTPTMASDAVTGQFCILSLFTYVNGAQVRYVPPTTFFGWNPWNAVPDAPVAATSAIRFIVTAPDIENGCVRLRMGYWLYPAGSPNRVMKANSTTPLTLSARKIPGRTIVVFDGQSFVHYPLAPALAFPAQTMGLLSHGYNHSVVGVDGTGYATRTADAATRVDPLITNGTKRVIVDAGFQTDLLTGSTAAQCVTLATTYHTARRTAGFTAIVGLTVPPSTLYSGPQNTQRLALNDLLRANPAPFDVVADIAARTELSDASNLTYFADGLHPTAAGAAVIAEEVVDALNTLGVS